jgi:hypothetical protein
MISPNPELLEQNDQSSSVTHEDDVLSEFRLPPRACADDNDHKLAEQDEGEDNIDCLDFNGDGSVVYKAQDSSDPETESEQSSSKSYARTLDESSEGQEHSGDSRESRKYFWTQKMQDGVNRAIDLIQGGDLTTRAKAKAGIGSALAKAGHFGNSPNYAALLKLLHLVEEPQEPGTDLNSAHVA